MFDSEKWDFTIIEYDAGDNMGGDHIRYDGVDTLAVSELLLPLAATKLRYHFIADGAWSDQDGLYDTDGACIIDSITDAGGLIDFEDFESSDRCQEPLVSGIATHRAFGAYAGLANNLHDKDPCSDNFGTQIVFFNGSPYMSADYPGLRSRRSARAPAGSPRPVRT